MKVRILCLDIGERRIGVAVSDEDETIARGLGPVERTGNETEKIAALVKQYNAGRIVFGLPLRMDGSMSSQTEKTLAFVDRLRTVVCVPMEPWDERLSTRQAEAILIEADISRKKRKKLVDKLSAQIILQDYLNSRPRQEQNPAHQ